jgi:hypothetical protein
MSSRMARVVANRRFPQKVVTLYRPVFGTAVLGVPPATFEDPRPLTCLCQPAGGDDLNLLPEGQRLNNIQAVWSTVPFYVADGKTRDADVLEVEGVRYTVIKMFDRQVMGGYHKVLAEGFVHG